MARSRLSARPVAAVGAVLLAGVLTACSTTNPITTHEEYAASDGVRAALGDISAENLLLVAVAADAPGALQGALSNQGTDPITVTVATSSDSTDVRVPAGETVLLGGTEGEDVVLATPGAPGATTDLSLSSGPGGTETVPVPVLDGTLPEYTDLVPAQD